MNCIVLVIVCTGKCDKLIKKLYALRVAVKA